MGKNCLPLDASEISEITLPQIVFVSCFPFFVTFNLDYGMWPKMANHSCPLLCWKPTISSFSLVAKFRQRPTNLCSLWRDGVSVAQLERFLVNRDRDRMLPWSRMDLHLQWRRAHALYFPLKGMECLSAMLCVIFCQYSRDMGKN